MDVSELLERIADWEDLHTEFKEAFESNERAARAIVCFANTDGGQLVYGVSERDRRPVGVDDPEALLARIDDVAYQHCVPPITVVQETVGVEPGVVIVVVNVPKGDQRPYRTRSGLYYVRRMTRCQQASQEELLRLFQETASLFYDEQPLRQLSLADLDLSTLEDHLRQTDRLDLLGDDLERLLRNWRLFDGDHPTIAGLLLFGRRPQKDLPYARIVSARFPGRDESLDPIDRSDHEGRLFEVIAGAARFLRTHLRQRHEVRGFEREAHPELPEEALREAVVNAVAHRDYTVQGPVRLFVFDDRVEVRTPGSPPNNMDADAILTGVHVPRNPHIYLRLADAGLVTGAGTGVLRMRRLVRDATGNDLDIEITGREVIVRLPRPSNRVDGSEDNHTT